MIWGLIGLCALIFYVTRSHDKHINRLYKQVADLERAEIARGQMLADEFALSELLRVAPETTLNRLGQQLKDARNDPEFYALTEIQRNAFLARYRALLSTRHID